MQQKRRASGKSMYSEEQVTVVVIVVALLAEVFFGALLGMSTLLANILGSRVVKFDVIPFLLALLVCFQTPPRAIPYFCLAHCRFCCFVRWLLSRTASLPEFSLR